LRCLSGQARTPRMGIAPIETLRGSDIAPGTVVFASSSLPSSRADSTPFRAVSKRFRWPVPHDSRRAPSKCVAAVLVRASFGGRGSRIMQNVARGMHRAMGDRGSGVAVAATDGPGGRSSVRRQHSFRPHSASFDLLARWAASHSLVRDRQHGGGNAHEALVRCSCVRASRFHGLSR